MTTDSPEPPATPQAGRDHTLLTLREAAAAVRAPEATLRYWRHLGIGPRSFKLGRHVMYDENDLRAWIDQQRNGDRPSG